MNGVCGHCRSIVFETKYKEESGILILPEDARVITLLGHIHKRWGVSAREQFLHIGNAAHITLRVFPEYAPEETIQEMFGAFVNALSVRVRNLPNLGDGIRVLDLSSNDKQRAGRIQEPIWFHLICAVTDHLRAQGVQLALE